MRPTPAEPRSHAGRVIACLYATQFLLLAGASAQVNPATANEGSSLQASVPSAATSDPEELAPVVVTANNPTFMPPAATVGVLGERDILDVPFSISRIDREMLDTRQVRDIGDIFKYEASSYEATSSDTFIPIINIRGFESNNYLIDGLTGPAITQTFMIDSANIFKGPSSAFFGAGATFTGFSGAIDLLPKRAPQGEEVIRRMTIGWQTQNHWLGNLDLGERLGKENQFGYRLNFGGNYGERATDNYEPEEYYIGLSLDWRVTDAVTLTADLGHIRESKNGYRDGVLLTPGVKLPAPPDLSQSTAQLWSRYDRDTDYAYLRADIELSSDWTLELDGGYARMQDPYRSSFIFITAPNGDGDAIGGTTRFVDPYETWAARVLLSGKFDTGPLSHQMSLSYNFNRQTAIGEYFPYPTTSTNLYSPVQIPVPSTASATSRFGPNFTSHVTQVTDFIEIHPMLTVMGGMAHVHFKDGNSGFDDGAFTPLGGIIFKPWDNTSFYVGYSEGLEQGAIAPVGTTNQNQSLPPRENNQFEFGIKHRAGGMDFTLAAFELNQALQYVDSSNTFVQDGDQTHRGVEFSAGGNLSRDLSLIVTVAYFDTELGANNPSVEGNEAVGVPEWSVRAFAEYRLTDWVPGLAFNAGMIYADKAQIFADNSQQIPSWCVFDVGMSYDLKPTWNVPALLRFSIDNIGGKNYWAGGSYTIAHGEPRTFKVSLQYDF
ncbi:TonB-dependent siderophore receptor [Phragmitibacter flavus]|uniref:TonB-dependent siderophore receptor n=1 Tax=Phragmitibacter flavus TaxID=2576071 RepID=A0A5R8KDZ3_9BACT|nr:TonB-dependent siderophore receptor [Phragmitibacter flavus]TLD70510.1 TonB-dependent siderophore receptor [Phragmitibacter flavus]